MWTRTPPTGTTEHASIPFFAGGSSTTHGPPRALARAQRAQYSLSAEKGQLPAFPAPGGLQGLHHPLHLGELLEETIDLLHALARAAGDAALPAPVEQLR